MTETIKVASVNYKSINNYVRTRIENTKQQK